MKQGSRHPAGDGDQFPLPRKIPLPGGPKKTPANSPRGRCGCSGATSSVAVTPGKPGSNLRGWMKISSTLAGLTAAASISSNVCASRDQTRPPGSPQRPQVRPTAHSLSHVMGHGPHIGSGRHPRAKLARSPSAHTISNSLISTCTGFNVTSCLPPRQFVGWHSLESSWRKKAAASARSGRQSRVPVPYLFP